MGDITFIGDRNDLLYFDEMNKKQLKEKIRDLPVNLSLVSLALLFGLAEKGAAVTSEILAGPGRGLRGYRRITAMKTFWDYYDELKDLKENSARTILWRLQKKGLVKKRENKYRLTSEGLKIIKSFQAKKIKEEPWDGKWRLVMFDIPEKKREERAWLHYRLLIWDYKPLQKSVFIGKQPIEEDFYSEIIGRGLNQFIRLLTIGEIDDEDVLNF